MQSSIRTRLTIYFILLAVFPLAIVGTLLGYQSWRVQTQQALTLQKQVVQRVSTAVTAFFQELEGDLRVVAEVQGLKDLSPDRQASLLSELLSYQGVFEELTLLDNAGREQIRLSRLTIIAPDQLGDRSQAEEFVTTSASGETYYSPVRFDEATNEPLMTIAVPLFDPRSGQIDGILVADARIKKIWDLIASIQVSEGESVYIVDNQASVVAHHNPSVVLRETRFDVPESDGTRTGLNGTSVVLATDSIPLGEQVFHVVAEKPVTQALNLAISTVIGIAVLFVISLAAAVGSRFITVRQIVQPIETLARAAQAITAGDLSQRAEVKRDDEIGSLAQAFNSMTAQLQNTLTGLEQRVTERTRDLERRSSQLEAVVEVSRAATSIRDPDELLTRVTHLISERFGFYHVGIFLLDANSEYAVLRAANSKGGRRMLARQHKLRVGQSGMVGYATGRKQPRIAMDVGQDAVFFNNPDLPDTRSEMALPLMVGNRVLGALDVQSTKEAAFTQQDVAVLQGLADQVAVALENARLFTETQQAIEAERRAYGEISRQAWEKLLGIRFDLGFLCDAQGAIRPAPEQWQSEMIQASQRGQTIHDGGYTVAIPIQVRDQVLGVVRLRKPDDAGQWATEEVELVETLTEQLSVALESARLHQDTQSRAERERLMGEITARMRETLDIETVLKTTAQQVRQSLSLPEVVIRLGAAPPAPRVPGDGHNGDEPAQARDKESAA